MDVFEIVGLVLRVFTILFLIPITTEKIEDLFNKLHGFVLFSFRFFPFLFFPFLFFPFLSFPFLSVSLTMDYYAHFAWADEKTHIFRWIHCIDLMDGFPTEFTQRLDEPHYVVEFKSRVTSHDGYCSDVECFADTPIHTTVSSHTVYLPLIDVVTQKPFRFSLLPYTMHHTCEGSGVCGFKDTIQISSVRKVE